MEVSSTVNAASVAQVLGARGGVAPVEVAQSPVRAEGGAAATTQVSADDAQRAVESVNEVVQVFNKGIQFSVDESTGINVVKVVEKETEQVIRQLPIEAVIKFAQTLDTIKGLLVKQSV